ncbi:low molecular weight phosphatase family protein [Propionicicella superfundia]|uniref:arsenate reductase/protein-tyrosine-phosphatase family protein n=1 Tax=Propionicicella superfundia TaxID=348582 RepID=UPI0003F5177F|nr:low molecular weight phosphatase family protein [Propionicicella superfundia]
MNAPVAAAPVRLLTVCTGNLCRSPVAEHLLRQGLDDSVAVRSAGVRAVVGGAIDPPVAAFLRRSGVRAEGFRAHQVTDASIVEADLVLALATEHRSAILRRVPGAVRRTYTLREFARIAHALDPVALTGHTSAERLRQLLPRVSLARAITARPENGDDVPDPTGRDAAAYARALRLIAESVETIVRAVES